MQNKQKQLYVLSLIFVIILFYALQILLYRKGFYTLSADENGHTLEAYYWSKDKSNLFSIWLPFQKILYGISFSFWNNLFWTPRLLSSLFGLFTLFSLIFLSYQLFVNKKVAVLTGLLGAISWAMVIFSVLPMTEIYFSFFIISSLAFLFKWERDNSKSAFLLALIFGAIGSSVRFESWIFLLTIFIFIVIKIYKSDSNFTDKFLKVLVASIVLFVFPLFWIYLSYNNTGEILGFINLVSDRYRPVDIYLKVKSNIIFNFIIINLSTLNIIGVTTFFLLRKDPITIRFLFIWSSTLIFSGILTSLSNAMPTHNNWRLATIWSILIIPYTAYLLNYLLLLPKIGYKVISGYLLILIIILSLVKNNQLSNSSFLREEDLRVGKYISELLLKEDDNLKIFIQQNSWEYTNLLISSGMPEKFISDREIFNDVKVNTIPHLKINDERLDKYDIGYIILKPGNTDYFDLKDLRIIKKFNSWIIYKPQKNQ